MIRNLFVDFVIVMAFCAVVWGSVPVVMSQNPPGGITSPNTKNWCCNLAGIQQPCIDDRDIDNWCLSKALSCSRGLLACVCANWGTKGVNNTWNWKCSCS